MSPLIPAEVIEIIQQHLLHSEAIVNRKTFTNALCVSTQWRDLGLRLLWTDIVVRSAQEIEKLSTNANTSGLKLIRTLTITITEQEPRHNRRGIRYELLEDRKVIDAEGNEATRTVHESLRKITKLVPDMTALTSFSFIINPIRQFAPKRGFFISNSVLHELITSLPRSIRHLEVDTKSCDRAFAEDASMDICSAISERYDVLVNVRVRLRRICSNIIKPSPSLRSLVVNMIEYGNTWAFECPDVRRHQAPVSIEDMTAIGTRTRAKVVEAFRRTVSELPCLNTCVLLDVIVPDKKPLQVESLCVRNFLKDETTAYPLFTIMTEGGFEQHRFVLRQLQFQPHHGQDIVGAIGHVDEAAEGHNWRTTVQGSRVPSAIKDPPEGRRHQWPETKNYLDRESAQSIWGIGGRHAVGFWGLEQQAGRKLVEPKIQQGVVDVDILVRDEVPDEESDDEDVIELLLANSDAE